MALSTRSRKKDGLYPAEALDNLAKLTTSAVRKARIIKPVSVPVLGATASNELVDRALKEDNNAVVPPPGDPSPGCLITSVDTLSTNLANLDLSRAEQEEG